MKWVIALLCAACAVGCKKDADKKEDKPAEKTADKEPPKADKSSDGKDDGAPNVAAVVANDPWARAAKGSDTAKRFGAKTGDDFAKIDPWAGKTSPPKLSDKIDITQLEKPVADKVEIRAFAASGATSEELPGFRVAYNPSRNDAHEKYRQVFQANHVFEQVAEGLNKTIRIPKAIAINTLDCGTINAFYDPRSKRIIVCYELLDYFLGVFKPTAKSDTELGNAVLGATIFSFFHETGHGLIDLLELPAVGREEDSVDQLATLILISSGDEGVQMALSGAYWFLLNSKSDHKTPFWDEHAFDGQRFYNIVCLIYGSNPSKYGAFVKSGDLPGDRARRCPEEYAKINKAWEKLLQPHLTNGAAINISYKPPVEPTEAPKTQNDDPWASPSSNFPTAPSTPSTPTTPTTPTTTTEPTTGEPKKHIKCKEVAAKAGELIGAEAVERAKSMSPEEIEALKAKLEAQLPAAMEQILAQCAKEHWPQEARRCVVEATSLADAVKCK